MKIALIYPPSPFLINERVMPPLGILYVAAILERTSIGVEVIDLSGINDWKSAIKKYAESDVIGITAVTPQFPMALNIRKYLLTLNPQLKFIIGGVHCTSDPESASMFDKVIIGEGERSVLKAVDFSDKRKYITLPLIENLDEIPFPARHLIDVKSYKYEIDGSLATTMMTSRGCAFSCKFCDSHIMWGRRVRFRSVRNVLDEAKTIKKMGYNAVMFYDDEMLLNVKRDLEIFKGLKDIDIKFRCFSRTNLVTKDALEKIKKYGCAEICFGIESGSQLILDNINKMTTVEQNAKAIKLCHEIGLKVKTFIIVGLPSESWETIEKTRRFLDETCPDDVDITIFTPYRSTEIYENKEKYDIKFNINDIQELWFKGRPDSYKSLVSTSKMSSDEIVKARNMLEKMFKNKSNLK